MVAAVKERVRSAVEVERARTRRTLPSQLLRRWRVKPSVVEVAAKMVSPRLMLLSVWFDWLFEPSLVDEVFGLVRSGFPPKRASPSTCNTMNEDLAVANESASSLPIVERAMLRILVNDRVRGSVGLCHACVLRSPVGLESGVLNGLAPAA